MSLIKVRISFPFSEFLFSIVEAAAENRPSNVSNCQIDNLNSGATENHPSDVSNCRIDNLNSGGYSVMPTSSTAIVRPYLSKRKRCDESVRSNDNIEKRGMLKVSVNQSCDANNEVNIVNRLPTKVVAIYSEHNKCVNCVKWNPNRYSLLLSASMDGTIRVWDYPQCMQSVLCIKNHFQAVKTASWSIDGLTILSGGYDKTIRITDINEGDLKMLYLIYCCFKGYHDL